MEPFWWPAVPPDHNASIPVLNDDRIRDLSYLVVLLVPDGEAPIVQNLNFPVSACLPDEGSMGPCEGLGKSINFTFCVGVSVACLFSTRSRFYTLLNQI